MVLSYAYRTALIAFLPVIALLLYLEGQRYDPALITFQKPDPDGGIITRLFPEKIDGLSLLGNVRRYTKDNLYEYVNGHAEYFLSAGFLSLAVGEYGTFNTADPAPDVIIDIYAMGKSIHAFGVLTDESRGSLSDIAGVTGFRSPSGLSFVRGQYYVKLSAYSENVPLEAVTSRISALLGEAEDPFPEFSQLPDIGTVTATRFIKEAYRGLDFLDNVIEREYAVDGTSAQIFILTKDTGDINVISESFVKYFQDSSIEFSTSKRRDSTVYTVRDPYEGDWSMIVSPDSVVGVFGESHKEIIDKLLTNRES